jgi:hypothetical protein
LTSIPPNDQILMSGTAPFKLLKQLVSHYFSRKTNCFTHVMRMFIHCIINQYRDPESLAEQRFFLYDKRVYVDNASPPCPALKAEELHFDAQAGECLSTLTVGVIDH